MVKKVSKGGKKEKEEEENLWRSRSGKYRKSTNRSGCQLDPLGRNI